MLAYVPSVFQTLQTTDPGAEGEPLENHAKVRQTAKARRSVCEREREEEEKRKTLNLILYSMLGATVMQHTDAS